MFLFYSICYPPENSFFLLRTKTNQTQMAMELWVIKVMNQIQTLTAESMCFQLWSVEPL